MNLKNFCLMAVLAVMPASVEAQTCVPAVRAIETLYQNYLSRSADPDGRDFWIAKLRQTDVRQVSMEFVRQPEVRDRMTGGLTQPNASQAFEIMRRAYRALLARDMGEAERPNAQGYVNNGAAAYDTMVVAILNGAEYINKWGDFGIPNHPTIRYCKESDPGVGTSRSAVISVPPTKTECDTLNCANSRQLVVHLTLDSMLESVRFYSTAGYPEDVPLREVKPGDIAWSQFGGVSESTTPDAKVVTVTFYNRSHVRSRDARIDVLWSKRAPKQ